jgi:acetyl-CoA decarbonylase/synthase complex subunit epsilon
MSAKMLTGQTAEVSGPKKANIIPSADVAASLIKKAKRPLLVVGSESTNLKTEDGDLVDYAIRAAKYKKLTVVATAHLVGEFHRRGAKKVNSMALFVLGKYLAEEGWMGFDGKGSYDTVIFAGLPYYMEWLVESGLKNFSGISTISFEKSYQPNASWSLGWMSESEWKKTLDTIVSKLKEG